MLWGLIGAAAPQPDEDDAGPPRDDPRLPLHVVADDARLSLEDGLLRVEAEDDQRALRLDELSVVALHGGATLTAPALRALAEAGVPVLLHGRAGWYAGQIVDLSGTHAATRRAQYAAAADGARSLALARPLVEAKIRNAARLAKRRLTAKDAVSRRLDRDAASAARARSLDALRGIEGAAAAAWFAAWPRLLRREDSLFVFSGRSRRPAQDAVNALLSYLYGVLTGQTAAAALVAGLDPNVGFLHAERPGRPALALDLVEPYRTAVVDAAVIAALNNGEFDAGDFALQPDGAMRLTDPGRRAALGVLERRLSTALTYGGRDMSWRAAIGRHAALLAEALRRGRGAWPAPAPK